MEDEQPTTKRVNVRVDEREKKNALFFRDREDEIEEEEKKKKTPVGGAHPGTENR